MIRLSAHLPAPLLLGARLVARRPRRLLLSVFSLAVTVSGIVALMTFHATSAQWSRGPAVTRAITVITVMLLILSAVNAAFIAWTTVLDTRHPAAIARVLGATPKQITTGLSMAQMLPALLGALLGIPCGIAIYEIPKTTGATVLPARPVPRRAGRHDDGRDRRDHRRANPHRRTPTRRPSPPIGSGMKHAPKAPQRVQAPGSSVRTGRGFG